ncbi:MAG: hypothetical protein HUU38_09020 [Anaerolineales bacterium]|nr:hypothetical protein [Anaerolineales bacterium]
MTNQPDDDHHDDLDQPAWAFLLMLVLMFATLCGVPTLIAIAGSWAIKLIWGL